MEMKEILASMEEEISSDSDSEADGDHSDAVVIGQKKRKKITETLAKR